MIAYLDKAFMYIIPFKTNLKTSIESVCVIALEKPSEFIINKRYNEEEKGSKGCATFFHLFSISKYLLANAV